MQNHTDDIRLQKEKPHILLTIARVFFFGFAFFAVLFTVLYNMGGSSDTLKQGLEQFASRSFGGRPAYVERLNRMTFFPSIGFDASGINILPYPEAREYAVRIEKMKMVMDFFDVAVRSPRVKAFYLEGLNAKEGVIGRRALSIEKIFIDHDAVTGTAFMKANGKMDVHEWEVRFALDIFGGEGKFSYALAERMPFYAHIADLTFEGVYEDRKGGYASIEDLKIQVGSRSYKGTATFQTVGNATLKTTGQFVVDGGEKTLSYDFLLDMAARPVKIAGDLSAHRFSSREIHGEQSVFASLNRINDVLSRKVTDADDFFAFLQPYDVDMDVHVVNTSTLETDADKLGFDNLEFSFLQKEGVARISGLKGERDGNIFTAPVLHVVEEKDPNVLQSTIFVLLQEGEFSPLLVKIWDENLYHALFKEGKKNMAVRCGAGSFIRKDNQIRADNAYVGLEGNEVGITASYASDVGRVDLVIRASGDDLKGSLAASGYAGKLDLKNLATQDVVKPAPMVLKGKNYDALSAALLSNRKDDPCLSYIARAPEPEKKEEQDKAPQKTKSEKE